MRFGQIRIDIYDAKVRWFIGSKIKFQRKYNIPDFVLENTEGSDGLTIYYKGYHYVWAEGVDFYKVIPHECLHVVCDIFKLRDIEFDNDNHEHAAYLLGYLTNKIMSKANEYK